MHSSVQVSKKKTGIHLKETEYTGNRDQADAPEKKEKKKVQTLLCQKRKGEEKKDNQVDAPQPLFAPAPPSLPVAKKKILIVNVLV
jgi:hypothetical protein